LDATRNQPHFLTKGEAAVGFDDADVSVARDNTKQLKFSPESKNFEE
jgi:hypothetical protein